MSVILHPCDFGMYSAKRTIMKRKNSLVFFLAVPLSLWVSGCADKMSNADSSSQPNSSVMVVPNPTNAVSADADNSAKNKRDREGYTLTPGDQGTSPADQDLTQRIRQALVSDTNYSMTAKNIKIITVNGNVTLRGPVNSDAEKSGVVSLAQTIAGNAHVEDQLEVKGNP
jgi:osmotically-inducible protein OsmY